LSYGSECCSGRCKRDGKKLCKPADNQGLCTVANDNCTSGAITCGERTDGQPCVCYVTSRGQSFCGDSINVEAGTCDCTSNMQCERRMGKGAKCIRLDFSCSLNCPESTGACMAPCPILLAVP
jgi:hypothetical protein